MTLNATADPEGSAEAAAGDVFRFLVACEATTSSSGSVDFGSISVPAGRVDGGVDGSLSFRSVAAGDRGRFFVLSDDLTVTGVAEASATSSLGSSTSPRGDCSFVPGALLDVAICGSVSTRLTS